MKTEDFEQGDSPDDMSGPESSFPNAGQDLSFTESGNTARKVSLHSEGTSGTTQITVESVNPTFGIGDTTDTNIGSPSPVPTVDELSTNVHGAQERLTYVPSRSVYKCNKCGVFYARKKALTRHILQHHEKKQSGTGNLVKPGDATNQFPSESEDSAVQIFVSTATASSSVEVLANAGYALIRTRPFRCIKCGMNFTTKQKMERHIELLHGINASGDAQKSKKMFRCTECGRSFKMKQSMERHTRQLHGNDAAGDDA